MNAEKPAILIIDMVQDTFDASKKLPITPHALKIIPPINRLIRFFRDQDFPVVFSTDAFQADDFIFTGRMKPHSLAGTPGAEVVDALDRRPGDYWLPKPRFSAFFNTGLETWLKDRGVTLCAAAGISTNVCVLTTALDAVCHDFKAVLIEDCCAAFTADIHEQTLNIYRRNPLYPLLKVASSDDFMADF